MRDRVVASCHFLEGRDREVFILRATPARSLVWLIVVLHELCLFFSESDQ